ncbi:MAG TPA: uracil-DNA glycosylase [bacterium]|nr:uracil-DNA glycosylase [bacterium]
MAQTKKREFRDWDYWGRPVPGFGDPNARLLVIGLAPAAHGANRTGRMFTGDSSGQWLIRAMYRAGFASQPTTTHRGDDLRLMNSYLTAIVRCAPPDNRPVPAEISNCAGYLRGELTLLKRVRVVVTLGQMAFHQYLSLAKERGALVPRPRPPFRHGATYTFSSKVEPTQPVLVASYHPSRQNTQTGRLTEVMLDEIFSRVRDLLKRVPSRRPVPERGASGTGHA